jgi:hypothetical protein
MAIRREFPTDVDRVLQAEIESRPAEHELNVGGIAHEQHAAIGETVGQTGVDTGRTGEPMCGRLQGQIGAQHATDALAEFAKGERRRVVDAVGGPLNGEHQRKT